MRVTEDPHEPGRTDLPRLCVLASGSGGNCTVLDLGPAFADRLVLIDLGLSPRRTARELEALGLCPTRVSDVVLTHLDNDHCHAGWTKRCCGAGLIHVHRSHLGRARKLEEGRWRLRPFDASPAGVFGLDAGPDVAARLLPHDELGVAAFRFGIGERSLGFATDLGRVDPQLVETLSGVDVLAIESNYCPRLQATSGRPDYLKRRITNGWGHLSNEECADAVRRIEPLEHVVLLHLSRECNDPRVARHAHMGADYAITLSSQDEPTRWVELGALQRLRPVVRQDAPPAIGGETGSLFGTGGRPGWSVA